MPFYFRKECPLNSGYLSGFAAMRCIKNDLMQMFCECVG
ncbi:hypothetical protein SS53G_5416 [Shigella sonnei 53G]|nr:hypothetical protein SS53G_5416 [Shigella sonnei 53G]